MISNFSFPTAIAFGPGVIERLPEECAKLSMKKPLLVTDAIAVGKEKLEII